jgi:hypothetical protein
MARTSYAYTGDVYPSVLSKEITDSAIVTVVDGIELFGTDIKVWFVDALSAGDKTTLDGLVSAHDSTPPPSETVNTFSQDTFTCPGNTKDKWLKAGDSGVKCSDKRPVIIVAPSVLSGLTFSNENNNTTTDVEIYKNGSLFYTWSVVDKRIAYKTNDLHTLTLAAGDYIGVFVRDTGTTPKNVYVTVSYRYTDLQVSESGVASI